MNWFTKKVKLKELKLMDSNPRKHTDKQRLDLKNSLDKFSLVEPLVVNTDYTLIGGHFRYKILMEKYGGDYEVEVRIPERELNEDELKELNLRLNKNTGSWDYDKLVMIDENLLVDVGFDLEEIKVNLSKPDIYIPKLEDENTYGNLEKKLKKDKSDKKFLINVICPYCNKNFEVEV
ncbi:MAG: hypothetical protein QXN68_00780 [Thermoplasmata archaeon]